MTIEDTKQAGYITLKEASERFGYSPDYVGQLIRKGKIEGKQVYANLAWMTTVDSIEEYLAREKGTGKPGEQVPITDRLAEYLISSEGALYLSWSLKVLLGVLVIAALFVFYFLSIAFDHKMTSDAERALEQKQLTITMPPSGEANHISYEK